MLFEPRLDQEPLRGLVLALGLAQKKDWSVELDFGRLLGRPYSGCCLDSEVDYQALFFDEFIDLFE